MWIRGEVDTKVKKILVVLSVLVVAFVFVLPVFGAPEESIQVRVTPTLVSILVSPTSINFGAVALNQESSQSEEVSVTNNGSVAIDVGTKGSDATYSSGGVTNTWSLSDTANGANQYTLKFSKDGWSTGTYLNAINYKEYVGPPASIGVGANQNCRLKLKMPTSTTVYGEHIANVYFLATAH